MSGGLAEAPRSPAGAGERIPLSRPGEAIVLGEPQEVSLHEVDAVLIRTDPPFDADYLWCSLMLERVKHEICAYHSGSR